jgi:photosystem II stability/assembly factor-like uncharacterized protein
MQTNLVHAVLSLLLPVIFATSADAQWIKTNWTAENDFFILSSSPNRIFARTWDALNGGRMFYTTDSGKNWTPISSSDSSIGILSVVMVNNDMLAGTWNGLFRSVNGGTDWTAVTSAGIPAGSSIWSMAMINTALFAGTKGAVYKSSDSGASWTGMKSGIPADVRILSIAGSGSAIFAGSDTGGVFMTTIDGTSWTAVNSGLTDKHIFRIAVMGQKLFAVTLKGVFISSNNGASWTANSSSLKNINCLMAAGDQLFSGTDTGGVFISADSGNTWSLFSQGMPSNTCVWSLTAGDNNIYAGTNSGIWRTPYSISTVLLPIQGLTRARLQFIRRNRSQVAVVFPLSNPGTVDLELYDLCGNKILSLIHNRLSAGMQSVSFNTGAIAPGSYIIRLSAGAAVYQQTAVIQR